MWFLIYKNKFLSVAIMCLIVALFVVPFTAIQIREWSLEIHKTRVAKFQNEKIITEFEKQLNLYKTGFDEKMNKLYEVRPSVEQLIAFLKTMETMARQSEVRNFELTSFQFGSANKTKEFPSLRYVSKFETTPEKFKQFLTSFDDLPYYLEIIDFSLQGDDATALADYAKATLTFDLFTR